MVTSRKERDKQLRKSDILRAAEHVFSEKGYYKATMQDIAREAQYATGTVYLYFKDKDELYFSLLEGRLRTLFIQVREKTNSVEGAKSKLEAFVYECMSFFEENRDFFRIYDSERGASRRSIKCRMAQSQSKSEIFQYITELIRLAQKDNLVRDDLSAENIGDILSSLLTGAIISRIEEESGKAGSLKEMSGFILDIFFYGTSKKQLTGLV